MEGGSDQQSNPCAICLSGMGAGGGHAIFTAECSHTFHFQCISANVAHGNLACPLCNTQWRQLPFVQPAQPPASTLPQRRPMHRVQPPVQFQPPQPEVFDDDDETVEPPPPSEEPETTTPGGRGTLVVRTHTEYPAIARGASHESFAALVHVMAPGMITTEEGDDGAQRAPLDLVTVLDVSGSMAFEKLALLKQAMGFVVDNLGPGDRLSVVSFSSTARRVTRLLRMSDAGKGLAKSAVEALVARGGTNIADGLRVAAKVLGERRHRNAVASVILLSDGQDNHTMAATRPLAGAASAAPNYEALVPASFTTTDGEWAAPVHTFGFGSDHDAAAMHVVAEATGGTFSFIENEAVVQDAFAQCIGGLLTVVVQDARVAVECVDPGVRVVSVRSGRYESRVEDDGRAASVRVGELYADEERRFLLFLAVPPVVAEALDGETAATTLIRVSCSYRDAAGCEVTVTSDDAVVTRPEHVAAADLERSVEVARERVRVEATDDIAAARAAAERGAYEAAVEILERRQRAVAESEAALGQGGDGGAAAATSLQALGRELQEMRARVASEEEYARSGRAMMLSGFNMHSRQRANSRQVNWASNGAAWEERSYSTPAMRAMMLRSRVAREEASAEQQQTPPGAGEAAAGSSGP
ncbi:hypothetical protein PR202_ga27101 [Eleusine coracana subsp. coracana]|uniref:Uncharacterized protein n=1 Tax=Eleusine coracana subsp. coracana TaxID=191504 RepID=A0AAV5DF18_ELECO|nr:hypothetical protein QOZ80_3AG0233300 [Eleusine coracana subsp. coracana]GJN09123.1 hypothetical protein PR202_ga27101 [Eleusine coracana subsp. coracana]